MRTEPSDIGKLLRLFAAEGGDTACSAALGRIERGDLVLDVCCDLIALLAAEKRELQDDLVSIGRHSWLGRIRLGPGLSDRRE